MTFHPFRGTQKKLPKLKLEVLAVPNTRKIIRLHLEDVKEFSHEAGIPNERSSVAEGAKLTAEPTLEKETREDKKSRNQKFSCLPSLRAYAHRVAVGSATVGQEAARRGDRYLR